VRVEEFEVAIPGPGSLPSAPPVGTFHFVAAEGVLTGKPVTKAPYTAEATTEFTQVLADGTRIQRKSTSQLARDSRGRTRMEHTTPASGPVASAGEAPRMVTIHDPVARETIFLNEKDKTARRIKHGEPKPLGAPPKEDVLIGGPPLAGVPMMGQRVMFLGGKDAKTEPLGKQTIEGLQCEGARTTHIISAGEIGNDRPLTIVSERWLSTDLQVVVQSHFSDPLHGDTSHRLSAINRTEPPASLFQIPPDYAVQSVEPGSGPVMIQRRMTRPPEE